MNINENELRLPDWDKYRCNEFDFYSAANRQDLICRHKLMQIFQNFKIARENIIFSSDSKNYGDLISCEFNSKVLKKLFVQNALLYYNFCIDLSWQMVCLFCLTKKECDFNITNEEIKKIEKEVTFEYVIENLKYQCKIANDDTKEKLKLLLKNIDMFWNKKINDGFRNIYNYIKHQGAYDILDISPESKLKIEGIDTDIKVLRSYEFNIDEMTRTCLNFNNEFIDYLERIVKIVINPLNTKEKYNLNELLKNIVDNKKD